MICQIIFSKEKRKNQNFKMAATNFAWHFNSYTLFSGKKKKREKHFIMPSAEFLPSMLSIKQVQQLGSRYTPTNVQIYYWYKCTLSCYKVIEGNAMVFIFCGYVTGKDFNFGSDTGIHI